jgi:hypothetical protein
MYLTGPQDEDLGPVLKECFGVGQKGLVFCCWTKVTGPRDSLLKVHAVWFPVRASVR